VTSADEATIGRRHEVSVGEMFTGRTEGEAIIPGSGVEALRDRRVCEMGFRDRVTGAQTACDNDDGCQPEL
jgi:hypothetical protein